MRSSVFHLLTWPSPLKLADSLALSDAPLQLVQSGVEIAIMSQTVSGQQQETYEGLVLGSAIQNLSDSLDEKRQDRRSSKAEAGSETERDVVSLYRLELSRLYSLTILLSCLIEQAAERQGQFARVEGLPFSAPAADTSPAGAPTPSDLVSPSFLLWPSNSKR